MALQSLPPELLLREYLREQAFAAAFAPSLTAAVGMVRSRGVAGASEVLEADAGVWPANIMPMSGGAPHSAAALTPSGMPRAQKK